MKSVSLVAVTLLATSAIAQPHRQHQAFHHKRDGPPVVWVTDYDFVTETIGYTTTIWVSEGFVPPEPSSVAPVTPSTPSPSSTSVTQVPAQFFEPIASPSSQPPAPASSSPPAPVSTPEAATTVAALVAPAPSSSPAAVISVAPAAVVQPVTPVAVAPTTPAYVAPVASPTPAATPASSPSSGSTTGDCSSESSPCSGDITHYDTGVGACGWPNVSTDKVVALPFEFMGTQSNGNPFCGKSITITLNGKTTTAEVVDKCMGCSGRSIDLSDGAFMDLADMGTGRVHNVIWWFNS